MKILLHIISMILIWGLSASQCIGQSERILLAEKGTSQYSILISEHTSKIENKNADILQLYIEKISNVELPVVSKNEGAKPERYILLDVLPSLNPHEIKITSDNKNITISAASTSYLTYAIYEFLENYLDCTWLAPGVESIPSKKTLILPANLNYNYVVKIQTRTVHSELLYRSPDFAQKMKVTSESFPYYAPEARVHTFHKLLPEEHFFREHPEYFAWRNNRRQATQLCLSNPDVLEIVKDSVKAIFKRNPESAVVSVSTNDNTQYCTCDNCARIDAEEGSPSGTLIRFVNEVAKEHPGKQISTLAYQYTRKPCRTKPLPNVLITLCSIECDRSAPIEEKCQDFADDLRAWKKLSENIRIWDYTTQFTNFLAPFPNIRTLKPNVEFFESNNAKWVFEQHSRQPSELFELRTYLLAKLLWNPNYDLDSLITKFTNGYYKEAGPDVKKYIDLVHDELAKDEDFFLFLYGDPSQAFDSYLSAELLQKYEDLFDDAEKKVASNKELLLRVRKARLGVDYAILEACRKKLSKTYDLANHEYVRSLLNRFTQTTSNANITSMNEMRFLVEEYISQYKETINLASQPNLASNTKVELLTAPKKYANEDPQVLTDGSFGGSNFYANWLGFEGNDMLAVIDLGSMMSFSKIRTNFLQVTNHIVFFPTEVTYYASDDGVNYKLLETLNNLKPLTSTSKINDIQGFQAKFETTQARFIKVIAKNQGVAPMFHHAAGLPAWIFADEIVVN